ncbi:hypothetical protein B0T24DRAFT_190915 [Lasiosphaeria ovina]|uniref:Aminoglycoside phosphotransferase domain-containing protein n=1 Tax=Lasiosphaeria ovina TaxID=92902 RepID=A0AAE0NF43_9PEZI|nr:hypothetical protein B0T24DRAFT_190915 [Lasiosphaeria ovina]
MTLWWCDWADCSQPAVQRAGDCLLCERHLCQTHLREPWHECPKPEEDWAAYSAQYVATEARQMAGLCSKINGPELCRRASDMRSGIPCTIDLSAASLSAMMGGQNCHAELLFGDGVAWLARFRLATKVTSPPTVARDYILASEVATLSFLHAQTRVPVPRVFGWAREGDPDNRVGVGYVLMEKLAGKPLDWPALAGQQKEWIMQQLVDIFLELERHPFDRLGSIVSRLPVGNGSRAGTGGDGHGGGGGGGGGDDAAFEIQGIAHHATFDTAAKQPLGPFTSSPEAARALVEAYLAMILHGEMGADKNSPVDVFLTHRFRLDIIENLWPPKTWQLDGKKEDFFLKHPDDKGDHILVDDAFNIVGIIDWEWTQTVSREEAFSSPCLMWPVGRFYRGDNELSGDEDRFAAMFRERGRPDLADLVVQGRKVQRFFFAFGPGGGAHDSQKTFEDLFDGLRSAFAGKDRGGWDEWKAEALERYKGDARLRKLLYGEITGTS